MPAWFVKVKHAAAERFTNVRQQRPWFDHLVRAGLRYQEVHGNHVAAAIAYFSFLALFPLVLLVVSVAGFVLAARDDLLHRLLNSIRDTLPGDTGDNLVNAVTNAISSRGTIGIVALLGLLYAGLGWISNVRSGVSQVERGPARNRPYLKGKLADLGILIGLGCAVLLSIGLSVTGTEATDQIARWMGINGGWAHALVRIAGLVLAFCGDGLIFGWLLYHLPTHPLDQKTVIASALFAAVGFGLLKVIGAFYARRISSGLAAGFFGNAIGLLVWMNLVSQFLLYVFAWAITETPQRNPSAE